VVVVNVPNCELSHCSPAKGKRKCHHENEHSVSHCKSVRHFRAHSQCESKCEVLQ
jgi:hypothetical protein